MIKLTIFRNLGILSPSVRVTSGSAAFRSRLLSLHRRLTTIAFLLALGGLAVFGCGKHPSRVQCFVRESPDTRLPGPAIAFSFFETLTQFVSNVVQV